jgi:hypothetical protein
MKLSFTKSIAVATVPETITDVAKKNLSPVKHECQTCYGSGLEARHQICRDCDEV